MPISSITPSHRHYLDVRQGDQKLRVHYVDEGPRNADPVLLMHGEPSWSFLYRKIIKGLVAKGHRAVAPDLIGFGKSDKPKNQDDYTYERHVSWMSQWLTALDLNRITLFCQDWGGLIGLRLVAAFPDRFARVVVANTAIRNFERALVFLLLEGRDRSSASTTLLMVVIDDTRMMTKGAVSRGRACRAGSSPLRHGAQQETRHSRQGVLGQNAACSTPRRELVLALWRSKVVFLATVAVPVRTRLASWANRLRGAEVTHHPPPHSIAVLLFVAGDSGPRVSSTMAH